MAERGGFEPPVPFEYSRFPGVRVKPLCHLSTVPVSVRFNVQSSMFKKWPIANRRYGRFEQIILMFAAANRLKTRATIDSKFRLCL